MADVITLMAERYIDMDIDLNDFIDDFNNNLDNYRSAMLNEEGETIDLEKLNHAREKLSQSIHTLSNKLVSLQYKINGDKDVYYEVSVEELLARIAQLESSRKPIRRKKATKRNYQSQDQEQDHQERQVYRRTQGSNDEQMVGGRKKRSLKRKRSRKCFIPGHN